MDPPTDDSASPSQSSEWQGEVLDAISAALAKAWDEILLGNPTYIAAAGSGLFVLMVLLAFLFSRCYYPGGTRRERVNKSRKKKSKPSSSSSASAAGASSPSPSGRRPSVSRAHGRNSSVRRTSTASATSPEPAAVKRSSKKASKSSADSSKAHQLEPVPAFEDAPHQDDGGGWQLVTSRRRKVSKPGKA
eukprot:GHVT01007921.1.p1 GENE.GHVT01007921.1~~GHVT01007921.1.p1  ORF type:complete len:190 (+),score=46.35 GHVT01007921.1:522-1091(+)